MSSTATATAPTRRRLRIRRQGWDKATEHARLNTDKDVADALGISTTTMWRLRHGHTNVGEKVIIRALDAMPSAKFEDLFRIVDEPA